MGQRKRSRRRGAPGSSHGEQRTHGQKDSPAEKKRSSGFGQKSLQWALGVVSTAIIAAVSALAAGVVQNHDAPASSTARETGSPLSVVVEFGESEVPVPPLMALRAVLKSGPDYLRVLRGTVSDQTIWGFLQRNGGAVVNTLDVIVVVQARRAGGVRIVGMEPQILRESPVLTGTVLAEPPEGLVPAIPLLVNLDLPHPYIAEPSQAGVPFFTANNVELKMGERETFAMSFTGRLHDYEWQLKIDYVDDGGSGSVNVRNPFGGPFSLTGEPVDPWGYKVAYSADISGHGYHVITRSKTCKAPDSGSC